MFNASSCSFSSGLVYHTYKTIAMKNCEVIVNAEFRSSKSISSPTITFSLSWSFRYVRMIVFILSAHRISSRLERIQRGLCPEMDWRVHKKKKKDMIDYNSTPNSNGSNRLNLYRWGNFEKTIVYTSNHGHATKDGTWPCFLFTVYQQPV